MNRSIPLRLAGMLTAGALLAGACSSDSTTAADGSAETTTTTVPTSSQTTTPSTTTTAPATDPTDPGGPDTIELAPVTIDAIGVVSVAPVDWAETPEGSFVDESGVMLGFSAVRTWLAPNPALFGLESLGRERIGSRWWDIHGVETAEAAVVVALTRDELMQYSVELAAPPGAIDRYVDTVATPALDAFDLVNPVLPKGELAAATVAIDGGALAYATGGSGDTTIVFESGWADPMAAWAPVGDDAAELGKVFAYDRPGTGHSTLTTEPRDGAQIVEDLRTALDVTGHEPPYVLVGHSLGGLYMELFARTHPDEVAGLVLVDSSVVGQVERCIAEFGAAECDPFSEDMLDELPEPGRSEGLGMAVTEDQLRAAPPFQSIPVVALVAEHSEGIPDHDAWWVEVGRERAAALDATFVLAEGSSHFLQQDRPDLVLQAIQDVIEQHRSRSAQ